MSSNNNQNQDFDVLKVVELARTKKYEVTSAGFAALDKIDKINFPKKMKSRKPAVQALFALSEGMIKFDYFTPEQKKKLLHEANLSDAPYKGFKSLFSNSAAPLAEEGEEEEIPEEAPRPPVLTLDDDEFGDSAEEEFEDDEDDDDDDDDSEEIVEDDEEEIV
jgi:hypothetical protein